MPVFVCILIAKTIIDRLKDLLVGIEDTPGRLGLQILFSVEKLPSASSLIKQLYKAQCDLGRGISSQNC